MIRFLLDTDHASLQERGHTALLARLRLHPPAEIAFSVVTVEEALRGRLAVMARPLPPGERAIAVSVRQTASALEAMTGG